MSFKSRIDNSDPDNIYLDLAILNADETGDKAPVFLNFVSQRDIPIIEKCNDWELSVIRFSIDTPNLPLMICVPQTGQEDINQLTYSVSLTYGANGVQQFLTFVPQNKFAELPKSPLTTPDFSTGYYDIYSYTHFINIVNTAFKNAYNALAGQVALPSSYPPYLEWDTTTLRAILNSDILGYDLDLEFPIKIYMNTPLFNLFSSMNSYNLGYSGIAGQNYQLEVRNIQNGNIYTTTTPAVNWLQTYQEYATLGVVSNPLDSIVFTTNMIPVTPSIVGIPAIFNAKIPNTTNLNKKSLNILTDLQVALDLGYETKPQINYVPSAEYRMISLQSDDALRAYDLQVFYKDNFGNYYPFYLSAGCSATMKILFRRKK